MNTDRASDESKDVFILSDFSVVFQGFPIEKEIFFYD